MGGAGVGMVEGKWIQLYLNNKKKKSPGVLTSADPLVQRPQMSVAKAWKHAFLKENYYSH